MQSTPSKTGHVAVNGLSYYYEIHGQGEPLLLLHGGLGSIEMFGPVLPMLAEGRQVIGVDLHGHGRSALGDREIMFRPEHIVKFYQLLGGGLKDAGWMREHMSRNRLAILPDLTHYEIFFAPEMARTVLPFLDGKSGSKSWAEQVRKGN